MSIIPSIVFPAKIDTSAPLDYPLGKAQNITAPSDGTGTPWDEALVNDWFGYFQLLIAETGIFPTGVAETIRDSDFFRASRKLYGATTPDVASLRALDSSLLLDGTLVAVVSDRRFTFFEVLTGTVADDGVRHVVFTDDANRYVRRTDKGFLFTWQGTFLPLAAVDDAAYLGVLTGYSTTAPAVADYRFPEGARLESIVVSNRGTQQISGLAFYADSSPAASPTASTLEYPLTPRVDVAGGETRFIPVTDGAPDMANPMALAFSARKIDASTNVTIQMIFSLELDYTAQSSMAAAVRRGDALAPVEAAGVVDLATRIADKNYQHEAVRHDLGVESQHAVRTLKFSARNNQPESEHPGSGFYNLVSTSASIDTADTIEVEFEGRPITLTRLLDTSASTQLEIDPTGLWSSYGAGDRFLLSFVVMSATEQDCRFHMREIAAPLTSPGHGQRLATKKPRRVWTIIELAAGTGQYYLGQDPALPYNQAGTDVPKAQYLDANLAPITGDLADVYFGGFQLEAMEGTAAEQIDGIALVGDDTMAGVDTYPAFSAAIRTAGNPDGVESLQVSRWLEMQLNARVFNRAIAGDTLTAIAARWATDITPIATAGDQARYVIIQGGAHDIITGMDGGASAAVTLAALKVSVAALKTLADADGLVPVFLTVAPSNGIYGDRNTVRQEYNIWLRTQYPLVVDINWPLESSDNQSIVRQPGYSPDGFNLDGDSKRAVGEYIARQPFWVIPTPSPYQRFEAATVEETVLDYFGIKLYVGSGSPEGVVTADPGARYWNDTPTGASDATYAKISGTGNTGWSAV